MEARPSSEAPSRVSSAEVAFVVREYLRQEGFVRSAAAFAEEATQSLSSIAPSRPGRSLSRILNEYVAMKAEERARTEAVRHMSAGMGQPHSPLAEQALTRLLALLDDYNAQRRAAAGGADGPAAAAAAAAPQHQPAMAPPFGAAHARPAPVSQSPSKKRKSAHPRRTTPAAAPVVVDAVAPEPATAFQQLLNNGAVHSTLAEVLTVRLQQQQATGAAGDGEPELVPPPQPSAAPAVTGQPVSAEWAAAAQPQPPQPGSALAVDEVLRDCANAQGAGGGASQIFSAILDPQHDGGAGRDDAGSLGEAAAAAGTGWASAAHVTDTSSAVAAGAPAAAAAAAAPPARGAVAGRSPLEMQSLLSRLDYG